ncbi:MAG: bifunctional DNA-formamidopyrimidine glycosylase/DNA-(apurinic or apyrimidinic site) lyase [bacterium]|nr:bifunctional DNA-formamidopyrimidine glycosylase/DNA-(apurinic or apyrimidinic site) lyase [bacterium]
MPELPEVETIARRIAPYLIGKKLLSVVTRHAKSVRGDFSLVESAVVTNVFRRAKMLIIEFSNHNAILIHLKMTGQILYQDQATRLGGGHPTADWVAELPSKHTRAILEFSDNSNVFFNDMRLFGWVKVVTPKLLEQELQKYAPDIISPDVTPSYFFAELQRSRQSVKIVVLDQRVVAGVGNIYANDALHLAKIHPARPADSLSSKESNTLLAALQQVIRLGIERQGATIHSFRHIDGFAGAYQDVVRTYGKEGEPCPNCGASIERIKVGGRGTFFCPECQQILT